MVRRGISYSGFLLLSLYARLFISRGNRMDTENLINMIAFTSAEKKLIASFDIPSDAFLPLLLSLRDGGDYSYYSENIRTIAILDKTTVYDDEKKLGYSLEEIYLFINPIVKEEEGT